MAFLEVIKLKKVYKAKLGNVQYTALKDVSFSVKKGEYVAIMGESGAGKTTLLNIISTLDKSTDGQVILDGINMSMLKDKEISSFRRKNLGFIFQDFNLLDTFSIKDNILLPLILSNVSIDKSKQELELLARQLGLTELLNKYPYEISGGQKQRVAVARALITKPKLVLADEPTGALDSKSAGNLLAQFEEINKNGQTILMVTHSTQAASHASRVLFIKDGVVFHQLYRGDLARQKFFQKIYDTLTLLISGGINHEN
ncbi:bacitracin export ATP-binding protein BceA [Clostridium ragsdalei P11]|uniref:Bacitracin export ATP-binding protein BceA n=1 Tax=Clostridium ragsdalei P11 TaxID=1353534 RepID=A0A1A6AWV3_9CLOT|nr:ABC transporter ATP-binding protein [Clostridium ragsdalei]OBR94510.1 bacitracin export ATP-binding protein BceA [Clostridium ragsdalei P11]